MSVLPAGTRKLAARACGLSPEAEAKLLDELFRATLEELMSGRLSVAPLIQEIIA